MNQTEIVLASASPRRKELMEQIGLRPEIIPSQVEEKVTASDPEQVVMELARQKARDVADRLGARDVRNEKADTAAADRQAEPSAEKIVVGSDTVVAVDGRILGKPKTEEEARDMIRSIAGRTHQVFTGVAIIKGRRETVFAVESQVTVYPMTEREIRAYVACGESMDKAGAYGIQGRFAAHIERLNGSYTNVMGLPAGRLYQELKAFTEEQND